MASSSSASNIRREQSLARVVILSNLGGDGGDSRVDSPFTTLDRALDEIEKMGRPSSTESVAAVVTRRPDAEELTQQRERRRSAASSAYAPSCDEAARTQRNRLRAEEALCGGAGDLSVHRRGQSMSSHPSLLRPGGGGGIAPRPKAKSEAAYDAGRSRSSKQQQQNHHQRHHSGYSSTVDNSSSWARDVPLRPADNILPAVGQAPRPSEGPYDGRRFSTAISIPPAPTASPDAQRPQSRSRRTSDARSEPRTNDRHSTYSDGGAPINTQHQRRAPRGVPNNYQAYMASRASWAAPSTLESTRTRGPALGQESRVSQDAVRGRRTNFEPGPGATDTLGDVRRHSRTRSISRRPSQEPASSFEVLGVQRTSTRRASGEPEAGARAPASSRRTLRAISPARPVEDPLVFASELRDRCTLFLERFAQEQREKMGLVEARAAPTAPTAPPRTVEPRGAAGPAPDRRSFFAPWMPTQYREEQEEAAAAVAESTRPSPPWTVASTLSFEPGEDRLDVRRPAPAPVPPLADRPRDDRHRLPSQLMHRVPADVSRGWQPPPPPPVAAAAGARTGEERRVARAPAHVASEPAGRRTLRRAGDVNVAHVRNGSA